MSQKFLIGSRYFFDGKYDDYNPKDTDYIIIEDNPKYYTNTMTMRGHGKDLMFFKSRTKGDFINHCLNSKLAITVGKFLVPEFNEYIGFTLDDLQMIKPQIDKLDDKHHYEQYIYNCYLKNNDFTLTKRQLNYAYKLYKKYR